MTDTSVDFPFCIITKNYYSTFCRCEVKIFLMHLFLSEHILNKNYSVLLIKITFGNMLLPLHYFLVDRKMD